MKKLFFLLIASLTAFCISAQTNIADTNYATRVVSVAWMPNGKALLVAVIKYHKTSQQAPFFSKVFRYDLNSKQLISLFENGSNLAPSPDGKTIAFLKRNDNKRAAIYFYNTETKQETLFKTDTSRKNSLSWSPDGKKLMYNISYRGINPNANIEICILDIATKQVMQITESGKYKSYDPVWCPDSKKIVYYLEKGDSHDQVWLTDLNGSFHTNLTNDTTTHNYFPSWLDEQTIFYTQNPETLMMMNADGSNRKKVEGINPEQVKYNVAAGQIAFIKSETENKVVLFDWKKKTSTIILDGAKLIEIF